MVNCLVILDHEARKQAQRHYKLLIGFNQFFQLVTPALPLFTFLYVHLLQYSLGNNFTYLFVQIHLSLPCFNAQLLGWGPPYILSILTLIQHL